MNVGAKAMEWSEVATRIRERFSKLTEENIDSLKGSLDLLSDKLVSVYGYAKAEAEKEFLNFKSTLHSATSKSTKLNSTKTSAKSSSTKTKVTPRKKTSVIAHSIKSRKETPASRTSR